MLNKKILFTLIVTLLILTICLTPISFASNNYAYCISSQANGINTYMGGIWTSSYYGSAGYEARRYNDPATTVFNSMLVINPKILHIMAHGNSNGIYTGNAGLVTGNTNYFNSNNLICYGAQKYSWNNSSVVVLSACETAKGFNNITSEVGNLVSQGAVLGWGEEIYDGDQVIWGERFSYYLSIGKSVGDAVTYANSYSDFHDDTIKNVTIRGLRSTTIRTSATNINTEEIEINTPHKINYEVIYTNENDMGNINAMLSNEFEGYNPSNYQINITDGETENDKIIDLHLKIGDFSTNNGYVIFIKNNKVTDIFDNHTYSNEDLNEIIEQKNLESITTSQYSTEINQYKVSSSEKLLRTINGSTNTEQETYLYYDIDKDKKYICVKTLNDLNGTKAGFVNLYEI